MPPPDDSLRWFEKPDAPTDGEPDLCAIAIGLSGKFGGTPAHWLWEVSDDDFWNAVFDLQDAADAKADEIAKAKGEGHADDSWWYRHRKALRKCEEALESATLKWLEERKAAHA